jgi:flagella basal body P-ring formation protein FlgA
MNIRRTLSIGITVSSLIFLTSCANIERTNVQTKSFEQEEAEIEARMNAKSKVVCIKKNIAEGGTLKAADIEERESYTSSIPIDGLTSKSQAVGRQVKRDMDTDEVVCQHQLIPIKAK